MFKTSFFVCLFMAVRLSAQSLPAVILPEVNKSAVDTTTQDAIPAMGNMPIMTFDKKTINFGKIKTGDKPEVIYNFTNTGNKQLDIEIVSGCDCTELDWTRTTVQPGGKGFIKAVFNSERVEDDDHEKPLKKSVDIILKQTHPVNDYPLVEVLTFEVFIID